MSSTAPVALGNLVRLTPLQLSELPSHPSIHDNSSDKKDSFPRPDLLVFLRAYLDQGAAFLSPEAVRSSFISSGSKSSAPSSSDVELLKREIPASEINNISWLGAPISRQKPAHTTPEYWFARRSYHPNASSKLARGTASWSEFVFGLRDQHSKHEQDFTPTLYDAHHILDWNQQIRDLEAQGKLDPYSSSTLAIFEMCHAMPMPLQPRCFPVLVATASTSPKSFLAVTVPVNLENFPVAFYSSGRHVTEGVSPHQKRKPLLGVYAAVETVTLNETKGDGEIEWTMATASNAKGNLPMFAQKMGVPGAIVKDVGYFLKWIKTMREDEISSQGPGTS